MNSSSSQFFVGFCRRQYSFVRGLLILRDKFNDTIMFIKSVYSLINLFFFFTFDFAKFCLQSKSSKQYSLEKSSLNVCIYDNMYML